MKYVSKQDNEMMISNVVIFVVVAIAVGSHFLCSHKPFKELGKPNSDVL